MAYNNSIFKLTFPDEDWKETTTFTFEGPLIQGVQHHLVLVIDPKVHKDITLVRYAEIQMEGPKNALPGYELDREKETAMPDGTPAYEVIYHYSPAENVVLFQKQLYLLKYGKAYIFTSTFTKKTLETYVPVVDGIIRSFIPIDPDKII